MTQTTALQLASSKRSTMRLTPPVSTSAMASLMRENGQTSETSDLRSRRPCFTRRKRFGEVDHRPCRAIARTDDAVLVLGDPIGREARHRVLGRLADEHRRSGPAGRLVALLRDLGLTGRLKGEVGTAIGDLAHGFYRVDKRSIDEVRGAELTRFGFFLRPEIDSDDAVMRCKASHPARRSNRRRRSRRRRPYRPAEPAPY